MNEIQWAFLGGIAVTLLMGLMAWIVVMMKMCARDIWQEMRGNENATHDQV